MKKMIVLIGFAIVVGCICIATAHPTGYVGGTTDMNGVTIGGHPSEEQMIKDRLEAGIWIDAEGNIQGPNAKEFNVMGRPR